MYVFAAKRGQHPIVVAHFRTIKAWMGPTRFLMKRLRNVKT